MPAFLSRLLDPDFLFHISWLLTLSLFAAIGGFTLFLIALKALRRLWKDYKTARMSAFNRQIYDFLDGQEEQCAEERLRLLGRLDREILKESVLTLSETFAGDWGGKFSLLFEDLGFSDEEIARTSSLRAHIRSKAAKRLGQMNIRKAVPALNRLLQDRHPGVRLAAARALGAVGAVESLEAMIQSLAGLSKIAAIELAVLVSKAGEESLPALIKLCSHPDKDVRLFAIELLGTVKDPRSRGALLSHYHSEDKNIRMACVKALRHNVEEEDVDALLSSLKGPLAWEEKAQIAKTLGHARCVKAIPLLKDCLASPNWWVRKNSGEALSRMGEAGQEALVEALDSPDAFARSMAVSWLDETGFIERALLHAGEPGGMYARFLERASRLGLGEILEENRKWMGRASRA